MTRSLNQNDQKLAGANPPFDKVVKLPAPFSDNRGTIQPLVDDEMKSALLIHSKAGSLRANHYHKTDWHYCYVISGQINYFYRETGSKSEPELITVNENEMIFTPPKVDHAMVFPVDTIFLTLSRNSRGKEAYETDLVRIQMLKQDGLLTGLADSDK